MKTFGVDVEDKKAMKNPFGKVRPLLDRLNPENVKNVTERFLECTSAANQMQMATVLGLIFDKAVEMPKFGNLYARLCRDKTDYDLKYNKHGFQAQLSNILKNMFKTRVPADSDYLRQRKFAVFRFVGHLYCNGLTSSDMVSQCIHELLTDVDIDGNGAVKVSEASLRCGLKIMETVGKMLDNSSDSQFLFDMLNETKDRLSSEKLKDKVVKLLRKRENGWNDPDEVPEQAPMVTVITIQDEVRAEEKDEVKVNQDEQKAAEKMLKKVNITTLDFISNVPMFQVIEDDYATAVAALRAAYVRIQAKNSSGEPVTVSLSLMFIILITIFQNESVNIQFLVKTVLQEIRRLESEKERISWELRTVRSACQSQEGKFFEQQLQMIQKNESLYTTISELKAELRQKEESYCSDETFKKIKENYVAEKKAEDPSYDEEADEKMSLDVMVKELLDEKEKILSHKSLEDWKFNAMKKAYQMEKEKRMALEGKVAPIPVDEDVPKVEVDEMSVNQETEDIEMIEKEVVLQEMQKSELQKVYACMNQGADVEAEVAKIHEEHAEKVAEMRRTRLASFAESQAVTEKKKKVSVLNRLMKCLKTGTSFFFLSK